MAAGDITILGPYAVGDKTAIDTGLTGQVVVADDIVAYPVGLDQVMFVVVKAA
jgi:hypothetical protein